MTDRLFDNGMLFDFDARVISCEPAKRGFEVVLDRSAFFFEGGGQAADTGTLGDARVIDVRDRCGETVHITDRALTVGSTVHGTIDRSVRFRRMQEHTGEHLLTGIIHRKFGYNNVGFHLGSECVLLDLDGALTADELRICELEANRIIGEDRRVTITYPTADELQALDYRSKLELTENVRIVTIEDCDACACCAPHVPSTGMIGMVKVISSENYKGGTRIRLLCGLDALDDYNRRLDAVYAVSRTLSAKPDRIAEHVERLADENSALKYRIGELERERAADITASLTNDSRRSFCIFIGSMNSDIARSIANHGVTLTDGVFGLFMASGEGYSYIMASESVDMREVAKKMNAALSGKGGGSGTMVQGSVKAQRRDIEDFFGRI